LNGIFLLPKSNRNTGAFAMKTYVLFTIASVALAIVLAGISCDANAAPRKSSQRIQRQNRKPTSIGPRRPQLDGFKKNPGGPVGLNPQPLPPKQFRRLGK
jgi:hypothetical protein